jgi:hypothetical protein
MAAAVAETPVTKTAMLETAMLETAMLETAMIEAVTEPADETEWDEAVVAVIGGTIVIGRLISIARRHAAIGHGVVAWRARVVGLRRRRLRRRRE